MQKREKWCRCCGMELTPKVRYYERVRRLNYKRKDGTTSTRLYVQTQKRTYRPRKFCDNPCRLAYQNHPEEYGQWMQEKGETELLITDLPRQQ